MHVCDNYNNNALIKFYEDTEMMELYSQFQKHFSVKHTRNCGTKKTLTTLVTNRFATSERESDKTDH